MEYRKDLLGVEKKSTFKKILGILFLAFFIFWIVVKNRNGSIIKPFDWLYPVIFALNGVVHILEGFGFRIERLFGKAFVIIDNEKILMKQTVIKKEQSIYWNSIKSIDYKVNKYYVQHIDNTSMILNLSKLDYSLKNEIKETISCIAKDKNIAVN